MVVKWLDEPEAHDFDAAADYLSLVCDPDVVEKTVAALRSAEPAYRKAKDILRAAHLDPLPTSNPHVKVGPGQDPQWNAALTHPACA